MGKRRNLRRKRMKKGSGMGRSIRGTLLTLAFCTLLFLTAAGITGSFLAEKVVAPVLSFFGIYDFDTEHATGDGRPGSGNQVEVTLFGLEYYMLQTGAFSIEKTQRRRPRR
ncbi:hypothetical protein LJC20_00960 [Eubacteriales bacterium OttesenSCG-928-M02]|nr:hypothetical protein [Eubacteriales bacterium OttesenSCG-928-M02]